MACGLCYECLGHMQCVSKPLVTDKEIGTKSRICSRDIIVDCADTVADMRPDSSSDQ